MLITGSYPPKVCGVGDYTFKLLSFLNQNSGFNFDLYYKDKWSLINFNRYFKDLKSKSFDFYHLQYPTEGYGYSLVPLLLIAFLPRKKTIVTIHELSSRNFLAYVYTLLLIFLARTVIVSNELERLHASRFLVNKKKVRIIPIASNIKASEFSGKKFEEREIDLACFGHIRPLKGIEEFIKAVSMLPNIKDTAIIGQSLERYEQFFTDIKEEAKKLNIQVIDNKEEEELANILANVKIIYLPFPDGVSNRRGSLLASIQNGCVILTTKSNHEHFNIYFGKYCYLVESNAEAVKSINDLLKGNLEIKDTSDLIAEFSWENVIKRHYNVYNSLKINNE